MGGLVIEKSQRFERPSTKERKNNSRFPVVSPQTKFDEKHNLVELAANISGLGLQRLSHVVKEVGA